MGQNFFLMSHRDQLPPGIGFFGFWDLKNVNFGEKHPYKQFLESIQKFHKNRFFGPYGLKHLKKRENIDFSEK